MKIIYLIFFLASIVSNCYSQENLVYNGDFEEYSDCPLYFTGGGSNPEINKCLGWRAPTSGTSDYYNECSTNMSVPSNLQGYQPASSGVAYVGLIANSMQVSDNGYYYREYIQGSLIETLIEGETYELSFDISLSNELQVSLSEFGAYFSDDTIGSQDWAVLNVTPQCNFVKSNFYSDTAEWMHVKSTFEAIGTEDYITIGCFTDPLNIQYYNYFNVEDSVEVSSYYFIDDVRLIRKVSDPELPNVFTPNNDGVNDVWKREECFNCEEGLDIVIQNRWGDIITIGWLDDFQWDGKTAYGEKCVEGTYFYRLSNGKKGFIQLVR